MKENGKAKDPMLLVNPTKKEKEEFIDELFNKKIKEYNEMEITEHVDYIRNAETEQVEFLNKDIVEAIRIALETNKEIRINLDEKVVFIEK